MSSQTNKFESINGQYIKFYFTKNTLLPELLKNTGAVIILQEYVDQSNSLLDKAYYDECVSKGIEPYIYSMWIFNTKIMSGHGLFNNSKDLVNEKLELLLEQIDNKINISDGNYVARYPEDGFLTDNTKTFFDGSSERVDTRLDVSETYLSDSDSNYVKLCKIKEYIEKQILSYHAVKHVTLRNVLYTIEYYDNMFCSNPKYKSITYDNIYYTATKLSDINQIEEFVPHVYAYEMSHSSLLNRIIIQFDVDLPAAISDTDTYTIHGRINEDNDYFVVCENNGSALHVSLTASYNKMVNLLSKNTKLDQNYLSACLEFKFENSSDYDLNLYLPTIYFNNQLIYNTKLLYTAQHKQNGYRMNMYCFNDSNIYVQDFTLNTGQYYNENLYNVSTNANPYIDRFYFFVRNGMSVNEVYVKCYSNGAAINHFFTNITNIIYKYEGIQYESGGTIYNVYGCNMYELFSNKLAGTNCSRMVIKLNCEYDKPQDAETVIDEADFTYADHWKVVNGQVEHTDVRYLVSTEYETMDWADPKKTDIDTAFFNHIT